MPELVRWCEHIGSKLVDTTIDTQDTLENVLIPEETENVPDAGVLSVEWPFELLSQSEEQVSLAPSSGDETPIADVSLELASVDSGANTIGFRVVTHHGSSNLSLISTLLSQVLSKSKISYFPSSGTSISTPSGMICGSPRAVRLSRIPIRCR